MLFSPDHIIPNLKANERFAAIRELVAHLVDVGRIRPEDEEGVVEAAIKREKSMSTGIGLGYASPRGFLKDSCELKCKSHQFQFVRLAIGRDDKHDDEGYGLVIESIEFYARSSNTYGQHDVFDAIHTRARPSSASRGRNFAWSLSSRA